MYSFVIRIFILQYLWQIFVWLRHWRNVFAKNLQVLWILGRLIHIFKELFLFMYVYAHFCRCLGRPKEDMAFFELDLQTIVSFQIWVLGSKLGSSISQWVFLTTGPSFQPQSGLVYRKKEWEDTDFSCVSFSSEEENLCGRNYV